MGGAAAVIVHIDTAAAVTSQLNYAAFVAIGVLAQHPSYCWQCLDHLIDCACDVNLQPACMHSMHGAITRHRCSKPGRRACMHACVHACSAVVLVQVSKFLDRTNEHCIAVTYCRAALYVSNESNSLFAPRGPLARSVSVRSESSPLRFPDDETAPATHAP